MKLKKFRKNGKQKGIAIGCLIVLLITIAGVNLYRTFALYKEEKTFNVLRGIVPDFSSGDVTLAFTVNGEARTGETFPNKADGYEVSRVSCDNNVDASWLDTEWALKINNSNNQSKIKCTIDFIKDPYKETLLAGTDPVLKGDLVAVKIDPNTGVVTKADLTQEWYKYGEKRWANAVILTSEGKSKNFKTGSTIDEEYIESYFVWIPKYKYKIQTLDVSQKGQEQAFDIVFGTSNTKDTTGECKTPDAVTASGESGKCVVGNYMTHPAFLAFGDVKGLWVGKFETGYKGADSKENAQQDTADSTKIVIKPNQYSWRSIKVAEIFTTAKEYQESLESHMMKNTEWGAVAYLTQSIYGRCTSGSCTEITINNNSNYVTGYAAKDTTSSTAVTPESDSTSSVNYTNKDSGVASTTGNHTGIYDMSGGVYEYVMGVMYASGNLTPSYGDSGFTNSTFPKDSKYYDKYNYNSASSTYTNRILGDATAETKGWYSDYPNFVNSSNHWFLRGGSCSSGTGAGAFSFTHKVGNADSIDGFRLVLAM